MRSSRAITAPNMAQRTTTGVVRQDDALAVAMTGARFRKDVIEGWIRRKALTFPATAQTDTNSTADDAVNAGDSSTPAPVSAQEVNTPKLSNVVTHLPVTADSAHEVILQEWEGQVQSVAKLHFSARLVDITAGESEETEEADLPVDDVNEGDRKLLVPGAVFRWLIGYRYTPGQKERFGRVVIRRLPIWTHDEIKKADKEAEALYTLFGGSEHDRAAGE